MPFLPAAIRSASALAARRLARAGGQLRNKNGLPGRSGDLRRTRANRAVTRTGGRGTAWSEIRENGALGAKNSQSSVPEFGVKEVPPLKAVRSSRRYEQRRSLFVGKCSLPGDEENLFRGPDTGLLRPSYRILASKRPMDEEGFAAVGGGTRRARKRNRRTAVLARGGNRITGSNRCQSIRSRYLESASISNGFSDRFRKTPSTAVGQRTPSRCAIIMIYSPFSFKARNTPFHRWATFHAYLPSCNASNKNAFGFIPPRPTASIQDHL